MTERCQTCGTPLPIKPSATTFEAYFYCDEEGGPFCGACFEKHPCGKGEHDDGCPVMVCDTEEPS